MALFNKHKDNKEFVKVIEWPMPWDTGAPMPQVFGNGHKTYLIYLLNEPDPNWDGTYTNVIDNTSDNEYPLALVEFNGGTFRFGIANDEVFGGLSISNKGMKFYNAHIIENSSWIEEIKEIHKIHPNFSGDLWKDDKHYMFLFHDEIFEVIAKDYKIERFDTTFKKLSVEVAKRINE